MSVRVIVLILACVSGTVSGCTTAYKAQPVPFRLPSSYPNATEVAGAVIAAEAFVNESRAEEAFGFNVRGAGMLPVQVVFDNAGHTPLIINPAQTFLEDKEGNLWPVLTDRFAYERVTRYAQTNQIFKEGAYAGFLAGAAGALVGAAVGIVSGGNIGRAVGEGVAVGVAAGTVLGGTKGYATADQARQTLKEDFEAKSLENKPIKPGELAYGFIFFPGEATSARRLRIQLLERDTQKTYALTLLL
jgi:hypothetical protein